MTTLGRLIGVVGLKELRKAIMRRSQIDTRKTVLRIIKYLIRNKVIFAADYIKKKGKNIFLN